MIALSAASVECASCGRRRVYALGDGAWGKDGQRAALIVAALVEGWILYKATREMACPRCVEASHDTARLRVALADRRKTLEGWAS